MPKGRHPPHLVLGRRNFARLLYRLAAVDTREAQELYVRLAGSWGRIPGRVLITVKPTESERAILKMVSSSASLTTKESISNMPRKSKVTKITKGKPVADDIDELEAELEGLEEVPDEEEDAPEVEEDDDDEGEDYSGLTIAELKALVKERGAGTVTGKNKAALIALLEAADEESDDEDDESDEDEEDEGEDFAAMDRSELKAWIKEHDADAKFKKSQDDDDLRIIAAELEAADDEEPDEDEEDDDEEDDEPVPAKKKATGAAAKAKKGVQPEGLKTRVLPKGKLGANDIAEKMDTSALNVRNFLRSEAGQKWPIDGELGRYAFTSKQVVEIVKAMKSRPPRAASVSGEEFKARMAAGRAKKAAATTKPAAVKGKKRRAK